MTNDYVLSYTSAPLLAKEMSAIAESFTESQDWISVEKQVLNENILQKPTIATRKRIYKELKLRVEHFNAEQLKYLVAAPMDDIIILSALSVFKTYKLIGEFVTEVIREKYFLFDYELSNSDYVSFIESKQAQSDKLSNITESTEKKLRQVMFKMLQDGGFLYCTQRLVVQKPILSDKVIELMIKDDPKQLRWFLLSDDDIKHYMEKYK